MKGLKLLFTSFLFIVDIALGSPGKSKWVNEVLIGINDQNYYALQTCRYNTGTYYHYLDSVFIVEREIKTGKQLDRIVLRVIDNLDSTTLGDWVRVDHIKDPVNFSVYQSEREVELLFSSSSLDMKQFSFTGQGLIYSMSGDSELVLGREEIKKYVSWTDMALREQDHTEHLEYRMKVSGLYVSGNHLYLIAEYGAAHSDTSFLQAILVIPKNNLDRARRAIWDRVRN